MTVCDKSRLESKSQHQYLLYICCWLLSLTACSVFCDEVNIAKESEAYIRVFLKMMASWRYYEISDRSFTRYLYKFLASFAAKCCLLARCCVKRLCMVGFWYQLLVTYWYCFHFDDFQITRFMGPMWGLTWGLMAPCGTHIDPINLAISVNM